jgi:hypothetical protein
MQVSLNNFAVILQAHPMLEMFPSVEGSLVVDVEILEVVLLLAKLLHIASDRLVLQIFELKPYIKRVSAFCEVYHLFLLHFEE